MVSGIPRLLSVASGTSCVIGLTESGEIMGAGLNSSGTLGDNTSLNRSEFITAIGISDVVQIAVGDLSTLALRADGKVFGTGVGLNLGIGMPGAVSTFVSCIGISDAVAIAVGDKCSLVLRADGNVFAAGVNVAGCLGIGSSGLLTRTTFVSATGISLARAVANGGATMLALRADGAVYAVGSNIDGGLGNGTSLNHNTYVQSTGISNAIAIAASPYVNSVYALRSDGLVFACGYNWVGTLGDGTTINRSTYVQVPGLSSIVAISYGAALRSDGALFAVGSNSAGQLGNIPSVGRSSFVQVI
jgi:alpha-tubulin suppressor-like RCC1 family protein